MKLRGSLAALAVAVVLVGCTPASPEPEATTAPPTAGTPSSAPTPSPTPDPVVTGTPADPALYAQGDDRTIWFSSPSGNIQCLYSLYGDSEGWGCALLEQEVQLPAPDGECATPANGFWVAVDSGSFVPAAACVGVTSGSPTLEYGASLTYFDMACDSTSDGMRCTSLSSGQGFRLSRSDYELF
jgi:hypothetical protein